MGLRVTTGESKDELVERVLQQIHDDVMEDDEDELAL